MDKYKSLTPHQLHILKDKGTEPPFSGRYIDEIVEGSYLCRGCGAVLFRSDTQFISSCGWPSFDDEIAGAMTRSVDADGRRTEITCARCQGHLGHVFVGEGLTSKNLRHCVNSLAIEFVPDQKVQETEEAIVAGGCFWGVQQLFNTLPGVLLTEVGYTGGTKENPSYRDVCGGNTGHVEAVRVVYDAHLISYKAIIKYFLEIHDPTQADGQGPDRGSQYLSRICCFNQAQKQTAASLLNQLRMKGYHIATELLWVDVFWVAEEGHQLYYEKHQKTPYCHFYTKRFD